MTHTVIVSQDTKQLKCFQEITCHECNSLGTTLESIEEQCARGSLSSQLSWLSCECSSSVGQVERSGVFSTWLWPNHNKLRSFSPLPTCLAKQQAIEFIFWLQQVRQYNQVFNPVTHTLTPQVRFFLDNFWLVA